MAGSGGGRATLVLAIAVALALIPALQVASEGFTGTSASLPEGRYGMGAAWNGTAAYMFGGHELLPTDTILRYEPAADRVRVMNATLPSARQNATVVPTGRYVYLLGGLDQDPVDDVLRYDTANDRLVELDATLPTPLHAASAVWTGDVAYVFGGETESGPTREILRFDPPGNFTTLDAQLPTGRLGTSAVWTGDAAYVFGGVETTLPHDDILRFTPGDGVEKLSLEMPTPRAFSSAAWDGRHAYVIGGVWPAGNNTTYPSEILRFDPVTDPPRLETMPTELSQPRELAAAVWDGRRVDLFGGLSPANERLDDVLRYDPPNRRPTANFSATVDELTVQVDGSASADVDGTRLSYDWEWGDGTTSTGGPVADHSYATGGSYAVNLTVTDADNQTRTTTRKISVQDLNDAPNASFDVTVDDLHVEIDGSGSSDPDGEIVAWSWTLGDGTGADGETIDHVYDDGGTYTVELTVTDGDGAEATTDRTVTVAPNQPPTVGFSVQSDELTVGVEADGVGDPDGAVEQFRWSFGDGTTAEGRAVEHTYESGGTYEITLNVTDDDGTWNRTVRSVTVQPPGLLGTGIPWWTAAVGIAGAGSVGAWHLGYLAPVIARVRDLLPIGETEAEEGAEAAPADDGDAEPAGEQARTQQRQQRTSEGQQQTQARQQTQAGSGEQAQTSPDREAR